MTRAPTVLPWLLLVGLDLIDVQRNVIYTQAKGCWGLIHTGTLAIALGWRAGREHGWRLELLTPLHRFRWTRR